MPPGQALSKKIVGATVVLIAALLFVLSASYLLAGRIPPAAVAADDAKSADSEGESLVGAIAGLFGIDSGAADTTYRLFQEVVENGEVEATAEEVADVITAATSADPDGRVLLRHAEPIRVTFAGDRLRAGTVIDLREVPLDELSADTRQLITRLRRYASFLIGRPIWIALDSAPAVRDGDLDIGSDVVIRIGSLPLPSWLGRMFGFDDELRKALLIDLLLLSLNHVEVRAEALYLRADPSLR